MAVVTVFAGSLFSRRNLVILKEEGVLEEATISLRMALLFPVTSSILLLAFFYFFSLFSAIVLLFSLSYAVVSIHYVLSTLAVMVHFTQKLVWVPYFGKVTVIDIISISLALLISFSWILTGSPLLNDVIAMSTCIVALSFMHLPNIKVASFLLLALFFYDIFWVFYSEVFFWRECDGDSSY
eukprot:TRINITY_DN7047_c0_g1_i1.p1 TRINITY_DN7047_c0_g1~~TRINITY_DN7047_c0_g1_i1.p1  ORF type:complete len:201 (-),score=25.83 TRINITY_DN7047_c0_g1_i1:393-938(-)